MPIPDQAFMEYLSPLLKFTVKQSFPNLTEVVEFDNCMELIKGVNGMNRAKRFFLKIYYNRVL